MKLQAYATFCHSHWSIKIPVTHKLRHLYRNVHRCPGAWNRPALCVLEFNGSDVVARMKFNITVLQEVEK